MADFILLKDYGCIGIQGAARRNIVVPIYEEVVGPSASLARDDGSLTLRNAYESCTNGCVQFVSKSAIDDGCGCSLPDPPVVEPCAPCAAKRSLAPSCAAPPARTQRANPNDCLAQVPLRAAQGDAVLSFSRESFL